MYSILRIRFENILFRLKRVKSSIRGPQGLGMHLGHRGSGFVKRMLEWGFEWDPQRILCFSFNSISPCLTLSPNFSLSFPPQQAAGTLLVPKSQKEGEMEKPKDREIECSLNKEQEEQRIYAAMACLNLIGASRTIPNALEKKDSLGDLVRALLKVDRIERGRITCTFTVNPTFAVIPPQFLSLFSVLSFFIFLF